MTVGNWPMELSPSAKPSCFPEKATKTETTN